MNPKDVLIGLLSGPRGGLDTLKIVCDLESLSIGEDIYGGWEALLHTRSGDIIKVLCYKRGFWRSPIPEIGVFITTKLGVRELIVYYGDEYEKIFNSFKLEFKDLTSLDPYLFQ